MNSARQLPIPLKSLAILATISLKEEEKKIASNCFGWYHYCILTHTERIRNFHTMHFSAVKQIILCIKMLLQSLSKEEIVTTLFSS